MIKHIVLWKLKEFADGVTKQQKRIKDKVVVRGNARENSRDAYLGSWTQFLKKVQMPQISPYILRSNHVKH